MVALNKHLLCTSTGDCLVLSVIPSSTLQPSQDAAAAMSELELLFKYLDAMGTLKVGAGDTIRQMNAKASQMVFCLVWSRE